MLSLRSFARLSLPRSTGWTRTLATIAPGVEFDTVAREWRCKWSPDNGKQSLVEAQKVLDQVVDDLKTLDGSQRVDRIVCGGCLDFKIVTLLPPGEKFDAWAAHQFEPEEQVLEAWEAIDGISQIETQTYTIKSM